MVKLSVGPVAAASAQAWTGWAGEILGALRSDSAASAALHAQVLDDVGSFVDSWAGAAANRGGSFCWRAELHIDQLEYLTNSLYNLDLRLADRAHRCPGRPEPTEGLAFHVVLVEALLFALAQEGPGRAAFAEQLRSAWPELSVSRGRDPSRRLRDALISDAVGSA